MRSTRKVCVVTGSRAEYGLLRWLIRAIDEHESLELQVLVTGSHVGDRFGSTVDEIIADGVTIDALVDIDADGASPISMARTAARGVDRIARALDELEPDIMVVLGDRYEIFAAAQAAMYLGVPIAHISGGETTEGAIDEAIRHAITKMAHLHFVSAEPYRNRVMQLGEDPARVFLTGAMSLDALAHTAFLTREQLSSELGLSLDDGPLFACTYHPVTLASGTATDEFNALLSALARTPDAITVITGANADAGGAQLNRLAREWAEHDSRRRLFAMSLGHQRFLSVVREADVVIGNSSSGIVEAPALRTPTVNVGIRQQGRLRSPSVIDCVGDARSITEAIEQSLSPEHRSVTDAAKPLFGDSPPSPAICEILATFPLEGILIKRFHDAG
jgi:UDP-N-acetylglucosamine 2-epimerase (non-hydrolysing)